jgi:hypothetical protein
MGWLGGGPLLESIMTQESIEALVDRLQVTGLVTAVDQELEVPALAVGIVEQLKEWSKNRHVYDHLVNLETKVANQGR